MNSFEKQKENLFFNDLGMGNLCKDFKSVLVMKTIIDKQTGTQYLYPGHKKWLHKTMLSEKEEDWLNTFFLPNTGKLVWKWNKNGHLYCIEGKKKADIKSYNAFYLDFDLKNNQNKHYQGMELIKHKALLLQQIRKLPLKPDYIIDSRNGFHVYYIIKKSDRTMPAEDWHWIERGIYDYVNKIIPCVDPAVKKSNQLLRVPYSTHKKNDSEPHNVKIIYIRNKTMKLNTLASNLPPERKLESISMLNYSLQELEVAFQIDKEIIENVRNQLNTTDCVKSHNLSDNEIKETSEYRDRLKANKTKAVQQVTGTFTKYQSIKAIHENDTSFFSFLRPKTPLKMKWKDAERHIKTFDMRRLFPDHNWKLKEKISSLFFPDSNSSDYFFKDTHNGIEKIKYYINARKELHENLYIINDLFGLVYVSMFGFEDDRNELDSTEYKKRSKTVTKFILSILGIELINSYEYYLSELGDTINNNIHRYKAMQEYSKKTGWIKAFIDVYVFIMDVWREKFIETHKPASELKLTLATTWMAAEMYKQLKCAGVTTISTQRTKINRALILFRNIGLIKDLGECREIERYTATSALPHDYLISEISLDGMNEAIFLIESIGRHYKKPSKELTDKGILELQRQIYIGLSPEEENEILDEFYRERNDID